MWDDNAMSKQRGRDTKWDTYTSVHAAKLWHYFICMCGWYSLLTGSRFDLYAHLSERYHKQAHTSSIKLKYSEI